MPQESLTIDGATPQGEGAAAEPDPQRYILQLYVTGLSVRSIRAIASLRAICEEHLSGKYELKVINIYREPLDVQRIKIIAVPTLVKQSPFPRTRMVGNMSNTWKVLDCLGISEPQ